MSGGWEQRQARTRDDVLAAARALIAENGVDEMSMRKLADRAGVAVGTLYNQFGDRKGVLVALVTQGLDELEAELGTGPETAPIDATRAMIDAFDEQFAASPDVWRPVLASLKSAPGPHGLGTVGERILASITTDLDEAKAVDRFAVDIDTAVLAKHLLLTWLDPLTRWANTTIDFDGYRAARQLGLELALAAVLAEPHRSAALERARIAT